MDCKVFDEQKLENVYKYPEEETEDKTDETEEPVIDSGLICTKRYVDCSKFGGYDPNDKCN